ncbi:ABC transporter ATP-binding protein [Pseudofrankia inefficax]|uniref:ABC transporter related protein n=1 Tax=Pseudofrankia inefficax (strain DSM 45817 / CECT 9037 / DDB 130130 / EuI1c) TaxID=298654 RepID=E3IY92_PSEI1|nr:ABC transporter ATP-binding protein [Pseudofrankia inefficax]ADP82690.1 ABC transporter related protein [Pseudofrankia inefficax]
MAGIRIEGLTKQFGVTRAVDEVSLDIADGDFLVLLGPSGCGKTTLLRMIAGLIQPSGGRVMLADRDITYLPPRDRDVAMVFQSYALYPHLSVERNIGFPLRAARRPKAEIARRVREVATQLELDGLLARRPRELSGGQRQRVALGRALVRDPRAFLMDEPLSNLDAKLRTATRTELTALHRRLGSTFIYVTHDQIEAMTMATRVALLDRGRLEQVGTPTEVYDTPASVFVAGFLGSPPMNLLPARASTRDGRIVVTADGADLPLWPGTTDPVELTLGLRPEHLRVVPAGAPAGPGEARLTGTVTGLENLGSEEVGWVSLGTADPGTGRPAAVAVRGPRPLGLAIGTPVTLTTTPEHVHLFGRESGRRLAWTPGAAIPSPSRPVELTASPA